MVIKTDQQKVQALLREAITVLCKNGLKYKAGFCVEGLLGITLFDDDQVFLVNIKETIKEEIDESQTEKHARHNTDSYITKKEKGFMSKSHPALAQSLLGNSPPTVSVPIPQPAIKPVSRFNEAMFLPSVNDGILTRSPRPPWAKLIDDMESDHPPAKRVHIDHKELDNRMMNVKEEVLSDTEEQTDPTDDSDWQKLATQAAAQTALATTAAASADIIGGDLEPGCSQWNPTTDLGIGPATQPSQVGILISFNVFFTRFHVCIRGCP